MKPCTNQRHPFVDEAFTELLGLHNPAVISIDEIRRQIISASSSGLSPETLARGQNVGLSPQSAVQKPTSNQMRKVRA